MKKRISTALYVDYRNSTARLAELSTDEALDFLNARLNTMIRAIEAKNGRILRVQGDGVVALFSGADHTRNAIDACEAASEIVSGFGESKLDTVYSVRSGISTGEIIINRFRTGDSSFERASGITMHLAARLESACQPGGIVVCQSTYHLLHAASHPLANHFIRTSLTALKGIGDDFTAYTYRADPGEIDAHGPPGQEVLHLDRQDVTSLGRLIASSGTEAPLVLGIQGPPGSGKSQLLEDISRFWEIVLFLGPGDLATFQPFHALRSILNRLFQINRTEHLSDELLASSVASQILTSKRKGDEIVGFLKRLNASKVDLTVADALRFTDSVFSQVDRSLSIGLLVDELERADAESRSVLSSILSQGERSNLSMVYTTRGSYCFIPGCQLYPLKGLDPDERKKLFDSWSGHSVAPESLSRVFRYCGDNLSLLKAFASVGITDSLLEANEQGVSAPGSESLEPISNLERIALDYLLLDLPSDPRRTLETLSVLRDPVQPETLAAITGNQVKDDLDLLVSLNLAGIRGGAVSLTDRFLQSLLFRSLLKEQVQRISGGALDYYRALHQQRKDSCLRELAEYAFLHGHPATVLKWNTRYAAECAKNNSLLTAIALYARCRTFLEARSDLDRHLDSYVAVMLELVKLSSSVDNKTQEEEVYGALEAVVLDSQNHVG